MPQKKSDSHPTKDPKATSSRQRKTKVSGDEQASSAPVAAASTIRTREATAKPERTQESAAVRKAAPQRAKTVVEKPIDKASASVAAEIPAFDPARHHEEIARLAYALWQERGCPHGSPDEDWRHAEEEVRRKTAVRVSSSGG